VVVILRCLSSSSSSSVSFIIQRRDDEKREREREYLYKYKREERKQFQSVAYFLSQLFFKHFEFCFNFFSRKNLLSQTTTTENNNTNTHRTNAFRVVIT
jgi:hypothetical protein